MGVGQAVTSAEHAAGLEIEHFVFMFGILTGSKYQVANNYLKAISNIYILRSHRHLSQY